MNCEYREQFEDLLSAFLDDEVDEREKRVVSAHLLSCEPCKKDFENLKNTRALVRKLSRLPAPQGLWSRIQTKTGPKVTPFPVRISQSLSAVAASILILISFVTLVGYLAPEPVSTKESSVYMGSHAYHLMRQPLADHSAWSFVAGESNFELLAQEE